jgi:hypothetical protein
LRQHSALFPSGGSAAIPSVYARTVPPLQLAADQGPDDNGTRRNEKEIPVDAIFVEGANFSRHFIRSSSRSDKKVETSSIVSGFTGVSACVSG